MRMQYMQDVNVIGEEGYRYKFSVVMAVYNVAPFLNEAVDSLLQQTIGFEENVQLILVDDGSQDGSGEICDTYREQYPENIIVIHKENGGVSSARNEGLKYAMGRYLNFMDSDDKLTENTLEEVYSFFEQHYMETDIVTIPLEFFDAKKGSHWQNDKFKKGNRVLDLFLEYKSPLMFVNASFIKQERKQDIWFDSRLVCGEDQKVLLELLMSKMKYGVINNCRYLYRRRNGGEESLIQSSKKKYGWYFDYFTYLVDWAIEKYYSYFGYLPAFLQYQLLTDIQWRFAEEYDMDAVLSEKEIDLYKKRLFNSLRYFDDKYIMEQKMIWNEHKCYILSKKYDMKPTLIRRDSDIIVHFKNTVVSLLSDQITKVEFLQINNNKLIIEGYAKFMGVDFSSNIKIYLKINDDMILCKEMYEENLHEYRFGELMFRAKRFFLEYHLSENIDQYRIQIIVECDGIKILRKDVRLGEHMPLSSYKGSYYYAKPWVVTKDKNIFVIKKECFKNILCYEYNFLKILWKSNKKSDKKAVVARCIYHAMKCIKKRSLWLVSDRINKADDNGEALFEYIKKRKNVHAYFVIAKDSEDYSRLKKLGKVLIHHSYKHKILYLLSDIVISSHADSTTFNPFAGYSQPYKDIIGRKKYVFLQHGIIQNDLSDWLNRYKKNLNLFITSSKQEYNSILNTPEYAYNSHVVKLTGLPRYDKLVNETKKIITIMPTWRMYLMNGLESETGIWSRKQGFENSLYFKTYDGLLNNERLLMQAEKYGYEIHFMPHPNIRTYIDFFTKKNNVVFEEFDRSYSKMFNESSLLITDYSSVAFDFAYLRKPIIYFQFDVDEFYTAGHVCSKGYFSYEKNGFGDIEYNMEHVVNRIIEYMENGCQLKDKYRERIDNFFAYNDRNNCQRVYEEILKLGD